MISKAKSSTAVLLANEHEVKQIEQRLDAMIAQYGSATLDIGHPRGAVLDEIKRKYEEGGWSVKVANPRNQRDGVMIELS